MRSAAGTALPDVPPRRRRRRLAHRRNGQGRRPVLLLRHPGEAGRVAAGSPRWCCPTPAAPTSFRSTTSSTPSLELMHADGRDGQTFHLTAPKTIGLRGIYRGIAEAAGLPPLRGSLPRRRRDTVPSGHRARQGAAQHGGDATGHSRRDPRRRRPDARPSPPTTPQEALRGTGITVPEFASYAPKLWRYWAEHLDPDRARRDDPAGPLVGKHVIITGASSGIGRASAIAVAERGATVFALARNAEALDDLIAEIRAAGGQAHAFTCDVTDSTSVEHTVKDILGRFGHVDYLVNNAGPVDPPLGDRLDRPAARLRTRDGGQLLRRGADGAGAAAALARTPVRPRGQRVQRRRAGQQPEVQRLHPQQGGARRVRRGGVVRRRCPTTSRSPTSTCRW